MKLSVHRNITTPFYSFECPYCGLMCRERRVSRYQQRASNFCECGAHYVIFWLEVKA